ncbi:MAG: hypothetical protein ACETVT_05205 [bacterium]
MGIITERKGQQAIRPLQESKACALLQEMDVHFRLHLVNNGYLRRYQGRNL